MSDTSFVPKFKVHAEKRNLLYDGNRLPYNPSLTPFSRELRKNATMEERLIWKYLRLFPVKVYRQRPIDHYIVDFYFPHQNLVIEIDGGQHYTEVGKQYDQTRTEVLQSLGLEVLRFSNKDVRENIQGIYAIILLELQKHIPDIEPKTQTLRGRSSFGSQHN